MESVVTIEKKYFETLLRRAALGQAQHGSEVPNNTSSVVVPKTVHAELLQESRKYHQLRQALHRGGVSFETLDLIVDDPSPATTQERTHLSWAEEEELRQKEGADVFQGRSDGAGSTQDGRLRNLSGHTQDSDYPLQKALGGEAIANAVSGIRHTDVGLNADVQDDTNRPKNESGHPKGSRADHTLLLSNLPEGTTHSEVTGVIKGGRLVDVWLRKNERSASVTFAEGASDFLAYARRNDIYIRYKRIEINWSDRQFSIPSHLQTKLANGHSRNLVIRGAQGKVTDDKVRTDMEHIHNLVIIATVWKGQDLYISTNSVNNATFARTCMMSRLVYKGLKIGWYPDECAEPILRTPPKPQAPRKNSATAQESKSKVPANRFNLLSIEDDAISTDGSTPDVGDNASHGSGIKLYPHTMERSQVVA